jgi:hypothetical protein
MQCYDMMILRDQRLEHHAQHESRDAPVAPPLLPLGPHQQIPESVPADTIVRKPLGSKCTE